MARTYHGDHSLVDYSTLNLDYLRTLPVYKKPPTYEVSRHWGACCAGDPPGYPTYLLRGVYTQYDNSPRRGTQHVITGPDGTLYAVPERADHARAYPVLSHEDQEDRHVGYMPRSLERRLWLPLPEDHPRVQVWMQRTYQHFQHCYHDPAQPRNNPLLVWPIPDYILDKIAIADHFPSERFIGWLSGTHPEAVAAWREATVFAVRSGSEYSAFRAYMRKVYPDLIAEYDALSDAEVAPLHTAYIESRRHLAISENHQAVRSIRQFYPEHEARLEWIVAPPQIAQDDWWHLYASREAALQAGGDIL